MSIDDSNLSDALRGGSNMKMALLGPGVSSSQTMGWKHISLFAAISMSRVLIVGCLGNKISNMVHLPKVLHSHFKTDEEINQFLININKSIKFVDNMFNKYYSFKLNRRKGNNIYHSEFQIVSLIANLFIIQYGNIEEIDFERKKVNLSIIKNKNIKKVEQNFRDWAFIRYVYDNLNNHWVGRGDKKIDEIIMNPNYYTQQISSETCENALYNWFHLSNDSKNER